jgi:glutamate-1-semialdehyde 2,1-aminomutase
LKTQPVLETIRDRGVAVMEGTHRIIESNKLRDVFSVSGHPSWSFLNLRDSRGYLAFEIKTLLMQELHQRGILSLGTHNMSYAHSTADVAVLLSAYEEVLPYIGKVLDAKTMATALRCAPLVPLFKLR